MQVATQTSFPHAGASRLTRRLSAGVLLALSVGASAADRKPSNAEARYQQERAACESGQSTEDRATCLREAAAARAAARNGQLDEPQENYEKNALARCEALPPADREACRHRTRDEGVTEGSVAGGGIIREYREITLPPATPLEGQPEH